MSELKTCPFCQSAIVPALDPNGKLVCPLCRNTGLSQASPPPAAPTWPTPAYTPVAPPYGQPSFVRANAKGATASMVLGIVGLVVWYAGIVLAPLALVFGYKAKRRIAESGGTLGGAGKAKAGRILGWIWVGAVPAIVILVVLLGVHLGGAVTEIDDSATIPAGRFYMQGFRVLGVPANVTYMIDDPAGNVDTAAFRAVDDASDPQPSGGASWGSAAGPQITRTALLPVGQYALMIGCGSSLDACTVHYTIKISKA